MVNILASNDFQSKKIGTKHDTLIIINLKKIMGSIE